MNTRKLLETAQQRPSWPLFYPRVYREAEQFGDPRLAALSQVVVADTLGLDASTDAIAAVGARLLEYNVPTLFIDREFAEAAARSDPPGDLYWADIKLPFAAAFLIVPRRFLFSPTDGEAQFIGYARFAPNVPFTLPGGTRVAFSHPVFRVYTGFYDRPPFPAVQVTLTDKAPTIGEALGEERLLLSDDEFYERGATARYVTFDDSKMLRQLLALTFSLLLAITAKPSLVSRGQRHGRHKKSGLPIWTPNVVGRGYRVRSEPNELTTGGLKRLHWRRGHFRSQPFGVGRSDYKIIWIEPTLVGDVKKK